MPAPTPDAIPVATDPKRPGPPPFDCIELALDGCGLGLKFDELSQEINNDDNKQIK